MGSPRTLKDVLTSTPQPVLRLEFLQEAVIARIRVLVHRLYPCRIIDVGNGRNIGTWNVEKIDSPKALLRPSSS